MRLFDRIEKLQRMDALIRHKATGSPSGRDSSYYDAFGHLIWNINDKGDSISFAYDDLGRKLKATDNRGDIHYVYNSDTTSASFGQPDSLYSSDGTLSEWFTYDNTYGRLLTSSRRFSGKTFTTSYSYDWFGRPMTKTYPSGFEIQYTYTENGALKKISGNRKTLWECNDVNALGQITTYARGDYTTTVDYDAYGMLEEITTGTVQEMRYAFDDAGNLSWREDVQTNQKEIFTYDELSRLTSVDYYLNGNHASSGDLDISYDDGGIITSKSDVGGTIHYGENGAGPHALTSIENPVSSYTPPPQRITYTDFNKVHTIQDTIAQDTTLTLTFSYGLNNQRVRTKLTKNSTVQRVKYFNGDYEEDSTATGIKKYHYIHAPTGLVGIFVKDGNGNDTLYHVLTDHLGSLTAVINAETDSVTRYSYSAWGRARDPQDWTLPYEGELFAGRGYTGHEHLQAFSLINMNGRVYDPVLARFLSPDPFVQFPGIADGLNRYGYVMNNPLNFTDPSGYKTDPNGRDFSAFGDYWWNLYENTPGMTSGIFYYRGWCYSKNPRGWIIMGNNFTGEPVGFAPGGTYNSSNANHAWEYDYDNNIYRNRLTGESHNPRTSDFDRFFNRLSSDLGYERWVFEGALFFYEQEGKSNLYVNGHLNKYDGSSSLIAANGGGSDGLSLSDINTGLAFGTGAGAIELGNKLRPLRPIRLNNGSLLRQGTIARNLNSGALMSGSRYLQTARGVLYWTGAGAGVFGMGLSTYNYINGGISGARYGADMFFGVVGFMGPAGLMVSGVYYIVTSEGFQSAVDQSHKEIQQYKESGSIFQYSFFRNGGMCFAAGTKISMGDGSLKPIESVMIGDTILTYDFAKERIIKTE